MSALHISISAETITHIGSLSITNSMLSTTLVTTLIVLACVVIRLALSNPKKPTRFQALAEMLIEYLNNLCTDVSGSTKKASMFAPLVISFFVFIWLNNWSGLIPGVGSIGFTRMENGISTFVPLFRGGTSDLNTTVGLALLSVLYVQIIGIHSLGIHYFSKFINFKTPMKAFVGILETVLEFAKVVSFAFRLFGNIFAGEVLLAVMTFLVPIIIPMPFYIMEIFVGFIQAFVFAILSLVFFNLATLGHSSEEHS